MISARDALAKNRRDAMALAERIGASRVRAHLAAAEADLLKRLDRLDPAMAGTFTEARMQAALLQVRLVLRELRPGMHAAILETGLDAANIATEGVVEYLDRIESQFRGVGSQGLAIDESSMFDVGRSGAKSSLLRRLAASGDDFPGADRVPHMAKAGVLERYGMNVISSFENELRVGLLARKPWEEIKAGIVEQSPFLQGKPASWAERIVRTETMGAYNAASAESMSEANEQLGDMVKILSATFDDRTASDSYAVHGQIRRQEEPFDTWYGPMMHPPARPNDREIVVPHRISWPLPKYLAPRSRSEVVKRWREEKRKGSPPATPRDSTIDRRLFGNQAPPSLPDGEKSRRKR